MVDPSQLREATFDLLTRSPFDATAAITGRSAPAVDASVVDAAASDAGSPTTPPYFLQFDPAQARRAAGWIDRFYALAGETSDGDTALERVLAAAEDAAALDGVDLAKHALMVFITHHPQGRRLRMPTFFEREAHLLRGRRPFDRHPDRRPRRRPDGVLDETLLDYWREDPFFNEHHNHWHIVYPFFGVNGQLKDRQGELFLQMHQQMLTRYATERLGIGFPPIVPYGDFTTPIAEPYDPGLPGLTARPANVTPSDLPFVTVAQFASWRTRLQTAIDTGVYSQGQDVNNPIAVTIDNFGDTMESNIDSITPSPPGPEPGLPPASFPNFYGDYHNVGHALIGLATGLDVPPGPMLPTWTSTMDPVFYRWHQHLDDMVFDLQEKQPRNDFSDAPNVIIRSRNSDVITPSTDIILANADQIPDFSDVTVDKRAYGESMFGGAAWDQDFSRASGVSTDELRTLFRTATFTPTTGGDPIPITYLDSEQDWAYFIRVENRDDQDLLATIRLWLAPQDRANDRRSWIELDTFQANLPGEAQTIVFRASFESSVIKKVSGAGLRPPVLETPLGVPDADPDPVGDYCECGWPYNLLLPRGNPGGMRFQLMAMVTTNDIDMGGYGSTCGSVSMCGALGRPWPDQRPMGYPFSRRFPKNGKLLAQLRGMQNTSLRDLIIRHIPTP
ncbi:MAG: hypothetical protein AAF772_01775 [Acidobacteriota bacterium]